MGRFVAASCAVLFSVFAAAPALAAPGEVVLANGDVLKGDVRETPEGVVVVHPVLGRVTIARAQVAEVRGDAAAPTSAPYQPFERPTAETVDAILVGGPCDPCAPPPCDKPWKVKVSVAGSLASGNSDALTLVGGGEVIRYFSPWSVKAGVLFVYNESNGDVTAERWNAILRVDHKIDDRSYWFAQVLYDSDDLADLEYRFTGTLGYGRYLVKRDGEELKGEVGVGAVTQKYTGEDATTDPSGYLGLHYKKCWKDKKEFRADYEFLPNFGDFDLSLMRLALAFELPMAEHWKVALGARFDYVFTPPAGTEDLDTLLTVGVTYEL